MERPGTSCKAVACRRSRHATIFVRPVPARAPHCCTGKALAAGRTVPRAPPSPDVPTTASAPTSPRNPRLRGGHAASAIGSRRPTTRHVLLVVPGKRRGRSWWRHPTPASGSRQRLHGGNGSRHGRGRPARQQAPGRGAHSAAGHHPQPCAPRQSPDRDRPGQNRMRAGPHRARCCPSIKQTASHAA